MIRLHPSHFEKIHKQQIRDPSIQNSPCSEHFANCGNGNFKIFPFYAPVIEDRGAYCFCPVCHSVILSETLTLAITFEW